MSMLSLFHGALGIITLLWLALILVVLIVAVIRFLSKSRKIQGDCDSIIFPTSEEELGKTAVGKLLLDHKLSPTTDFAEDIVSVSAVSSAYGLNIRLAQAVPSILTSLGILGTFVGLSFAVLHFDSSSSEGIRASIETLLSGMGTAFFTSVFGMLCSLVFLWFERSRYNQICNTIESLCSRVNKAYHRSSDGFLADNLGVVSEKIEGLQLSFGDNLDKAFDEKVTPVMNSIAQKLENPAQAVVDGLIEQFKSLTEGLTNKLTESLNGKMNELLDQFVLATDVMKELPGNIDAATKNLVEAGEASIGVQKAFTDETQKRFEKLASDLTAGVKTQMDSITEHVEESAKSLRGIPEEVSRAAEAQKGVTDEFFKQLEGLNSMEKIYATAIEKLSLANKDLADAKSGVASLTSKISQAASSIQSAAEGMVNNSTKMLEDFSDIYELNRTVTGQVKEYSERIGGIEKGLQGIFSEIEKGLVNYANTSKRNMQGMLDGFTTAVTDATQSIANATNPLHDSISGILNALDKTERSTKAFLDRLQKLSQQ